LLTGKVGRTNNLIIISIKGKDIKLLKDLAAPSYLRKKYMIAKKSHPCLL